jgi:hypothetical protein
LCPSAKRQGLGLGFEERAEREGEVVGQGSISVGFAKREKRKEEKGEKRSGRPNFI